MIKKKKISWPYYNNKTIKKINSILRSGRVNAWSGEQVKNFEKEYSKYFNNKYSIAVSNGTVALEASIKALGIKNNDEIIVTARSFFASASCILVNQCIPIFADVNLLSQNIDLSQIKKVITKKTRAIICVHLSGWPCAMNPIKKFAKEKNIYLIEDCSQAHGAYIYGKSVGSFGDISIWSFCQDKIISTNGEGGMISCNSQTIWKKLRSYKDHGKNFQKINNQKSNLFYKYVHDDVGTNIRMTEIQAATGRIQLKYLKTWVKKRNTNANYIINYIKKNIYALRTPKPKKNIMHAYYRLYVFVEKYKLKKNWNRNKILLDLQNLNIVCFAGTCPEIYLEKSMVNYRPKVRLINSKLLGETSICFPIHPFQTLEELKTIVKGLDLIMKKATNR